MYELFYLLFFAYAVAAVAAPFGLKHWGWARFIPLVPVAALLLLRFGRFLHLPGYFSYSLSLIGIPIFIMYVLRLSWSGPGWIECTLRMSCTIMLGVFLYMIFNIGLH